jgi:hypothetical protein
MPNSKSEKIKRVLKWTGWILGFASRFLPANIKTWAIALSTLAGGVVTLLDSCDKSKSPPASSPTPMATVIPTPITTPIPTPTKPPLPELKGPRHVKSGTPFWIELCNIPNTYQVSLYADNYRLGYMGFGKPCMRLNITLNQRGKRTLIAFIPAKEQVYLEIIVQ